jgi:hypothetical protein
MERMFLLNVARFRRGFDAVLAMRCVCDNYFKVGAQVISVRTERNVNFSDGRLYQ